MNSKSEDRSTSSLSPGVLPLRTADPPENWGTIYIIAASILGAVFGIFLIFLVVKYAKNRISRRPIEPPKRSKEFLNFERDYARILGSFNNIYDSNYVQSSGKNAKIGSSGYRKVIQHDKSVESGLVDKSSSGTATSSAGSDKSQAFAVTIFSSLVPYGAPVASLNAAALVPYNSGFGPISHFHSPHFYVSGMPYNVNGQSLPQIPPPFAPPQSPSALLRHTVLDTLDDVAPYVPTPTKCRSLIDEPWSTSDNGESTKSTLMKEKERMTNPELCYEMCCTGLAKVTLFIIFIILVGIVVGLILGLSVD